jgi:hypothetical protein
VKNILNPGRRPCNRFAIVCLPGYYIHRRAVKKSNGAGRSNQNPNPDILI